MKSKAEPSPFGPAPDALETRFAAGDTEAWHLILSPHQTALIRLGWRLFGSQTLAEDFCQDVFIRVYEQRRHYNPGRPFRPWLFRVAVNLGRDKLRQHREFACAPAELPEPCHWPEPDRDLLAGETRAQVSRALGRLKPAFREVLALRFASDLSLQEIADSLGIGLSAAKARLGRALGAFEKAFQRHGGERQ